ncbi:MULTISPECIES: FadR/GntR family transcriptional regulator [Rhizobium/Agrobacterium group]|uniref:FadR/GntR family transcriptional regulator n=1 Tax=Rhizobium/Agrobacterium group TaxID=227290 RepID=UPI002301DD9D|nr:MULTISPECIES: FadR/GntR family transcriptional regulator [Rhizobium/Agrobacterium group]MDA5635761.1 FadR/GntR family transcriptional regulator [Agrobacterium sp. ST15.16.024]MDF1891526.1 FadR/GntR family transcriptional regulator [Rhizobium rhizogenes]
MDKAVGQVESVPDGLVERAVVGIRQYMRENELRPGSLMPSETSMAAELDVSRSVTREAFRALAALGILEVSSGRRARVAAPDAAPLSMILDHTVSMKQLTVQQVLDVRRTLELRTVSLASLRRTDAQAQELLQIVEDMFASLDTPDVLMELDIHFHELIAQSSGNSLYGIIVGSFRVITQQTWDIGWRSRATVENRTENIRCHQRIAQAISLQNIDMAEAAMSEHFDSATGVLIRAGVT